MERKSEVSSEAEILITQEQLLRDMGLWAYPEDRIKFAFRLSPDTLQLTSEQKEELEEIAQLIFAPGGFIYGSLHLAEKTKSPQFTGSKIGGSIKRTLYMGTPRKERKLLQNQRNEAPFICRLDLALVKKEKASDPSFQILEIEGDKTHAFGYVSIADTFRRIFLEREDTPGIVQALRDELRKQEVEPETPVLLIVGQGERFYEKELRIFSSFAKNGGLNLTMVPERDLVISTENIGSCRNEIQSKVLVNLPVLTPSGDQGTGVNADELLNLYAQGKVRCLIPPNRFLGSKGLLGLISNGGNDQVLEQVLSETFDSDILSSLRRYIPETIVVAKNNRKQVADLLEENPSDWVVKKTMSSGMKGVALPGDEEKKERFIEQALKAPYNFVVQRKVAQETNAFRFAEPDSPSLIRKAQMFMRISPFVTEDGIATIGVTARESPDVHGAIDAIQIPVIFEE